MGSRIALVSCLLALVVVAAASARNNPNDPVQIGLGPYYGGPIGAKDWLADGPTTGTTITVQNVTNHRLRNVHVRVLLPGMKVLRQARAPGLTAVPLRLAPGGATFTIRQVEPLAGPIVGLEVRLTAKPGVLQCPAIVASYAGKSARWALRGWCWTQAP
jgi:hypothetical protein